MFDFLYPNLSSNVLAVASLSPVNKIGCTPKDFNSVTSSLAVLRKTSAKAIIPENLPFMSI